MDARLIRIPVVRLPQLSFRHVSSAVEAWRSGQDEFQVKATGSTEWAAIELGRELSIAWQWGCVRELIIVVDPANIRTNAFLIDERGSGVARGRAQIHLLDHVEQLPWRDVVRALLRERP